MKKLLWLFVLLCSTLTMAADVRISGAASYQVVGRGLTWATGINQNFILDVVSPSSGMCLNIRNNDVGTHTYTITPWITSDLAVTHYAGFTGLWTSTTISPSNIGSTLANSTDNFFVNTAGAAHVTLVITGGAGSGTVDFTIAQSSNQCGSGGVGSIAQSVSCDRNATTTTATATTVTVVAAPPAGQFIHVCAYVVAGGVTASQNNSFNSVAGCASSAGTLWNMRLTTGSTGGIFQLGSGIGQLFKTTTAALPLCFTNAGTGDSSSIAVAYTIF